MTMAATGENAQIAPSVALRVTLIVITAIATLFAIAGFWIVFFDFGDTFTQRLISMKLLVAPLVAGTALVFATTGRLPAAIATLAALMLVGSVVAFVANLPTSVILSPAIERVILPLLVVAALVLAIRNRHLVIATILVALHMIVSWADIVLFAIAFAVSG